MVADLKRRHIVVGNADFHLRLSKKSPALGRASLGETVRSKSVRNLLDSIVPGFGNTCERRHRGAVTERARSRKLHFTSQCTAALGGAAGKPRPPSERLRRP